MNPHKLTIQLSICLILLTSFHHNTSSAEKRKAPSGGRVAVVVDERLAALRATPKLTGKLIRRLGRGRLVAIRTAKTSAEGIVFYLVNVSSRTQGWIQREAIVSSTRAGDEQRLLRLIEGSSEFDRISRARIFLDHFPRSSFQPDVLLLLGDAAEELTLKLSRDAARRLADANVIAAEFSYFLNYGGLDRYNRQGVRFVFDDHARRFRYDGAAWREIVRRYPRSPEAIEARKRLAELAKVAP